MNATKLVIVSLTTLLLPGAAFAQAGQPLKSSKATPEAPLALQLSSPPVRIDLTEPRLPRAMAPLFTAGAEHAQPRREPSHMGRKIALGVLGGVGGFFGGGYVGNLIERAVWDCSCDDPGVRGFLIGAPAGAILGAIAGVKLGS
jgi:hypothetical protein